MIKIVDYGLGNVRAFLNAFRRLNIDARSATTEDELAGADKVILPGVGHFDHAMQRLDESGMRPVLQELVLDQKVPLLGVCVGMQMLGTASEEGTLPGLGWIDGQVRHFGGMATAGDLPLPHMGWNDVRPVAGSRLFDRLDTNARFYFLHSFYFDCANPADCLADACYGGDFTCAVNSGNIYGVQFHPEKSHSSGTRLLQNFAEL